MITTHSQDLIDAYVSDLRRLLRGADPAEASEIEQSITEHIAEALSQIESPSAADVQAVLGRLGPVERIVADADVQLVRVSVTAADTRTPASAIALLALGGLALVTTPLWFFAGPLGLVVAVAGFMAAGGKTGARRTYQVAGWLGVAAVLVAVVFALFLTATTTSVGPGARGRRPRCPGVALRR